MPRGSLESKFQTPGTHEMQTPAGKRSTGPGGKEIDTHNPPAFIGHALPNSPGKQAPWLHKQGRHCILSFERPLASEIGGRNERSAEVFCGLEASGSKLGIGIH